MERFKCKETFVGVCQRLRKIDLKFEDYNKTSGSKVVEYFTIKQALYKQMIAE